MFGDAQTRAVLFDTTGRIIAGDVAIVLKPGIGVNGPTGEHLEGGPHTVPAVFAAPLLQSGRARVASPEEVAKASDAEQAEDPEAKKPDEKKSVPPGAQVKGAPSGVQQRDPKPSKR